MTSAVRSEILGLTIRKGKHGRGTDKAKAVITLSKGARNQPAFLRIQVINQVNIEEIKHVTQACVKPGSRITSDRHRSYKSLGNIRYTHAEGMVFLTNLLTTRF